jgi:hypothetical protein
MSLPLQLSLGRRFGFNDWVDHAARAIVHLPLLELTPDDILLIGAGSIALLNKLHIKLLEHKARTSLRLPSLLATHAIGCRDQVKCLAQWKDICLLLNRFIICPETRTTDTKLLEIVETHNIVNTLMSGMSVGCVRQVKDRFRDALVGKDEWLIQSVVTELSK